MLTVGDVLADIRIDIEDHALVGFPALWVGKKTNCANIEDNK